MTSYDDQWADGNGGTMSTFQAVMIAEGAVPPEGATVDERQRNYVACWQALIDSGAAWSLQGSFGRVARDLIGQGICTDNAAG